MFTGASSLRKLVAGIIDALYTFYLFSGVDLFGTLTVCVAAALSAVQPTSAMSVVRATIWVDLHLLSFEIMNQITGIDEDMRMKPYRPIPSGRISIRTARLLYAGLVAAALFASARMGILWLSVGYVAMITAYNELGWARNWVYKASGNAYAYACYSYGAIVCLSKFWVTNQRALTAPVILSLNTLITGFVQDFRDVAGDAAIGRVTVPMLLPQTFARCLHTVIIIGYSTFLCWYWAPPSIAIAVVYGLAGTLMASLLTDYSVKADFRSYKLYNVWLFSCGVLPLFADCAMRK
ncbi:UbiA prenyltransferase family [Schizophyllum commune]